MVFTFAENRAASSRYRWVWNRLEQWNWSARVRVKMSCTCDSVSLRGPPAIGVFFLFFFKRVFKGPTQAVPGCCCARWSGWSI